MTKIDILLQGEAIPDIQLVSLEASAGVDVLLAEAARLRRGGEHGDYHVFQQDVDAPLKPGKPLPKPTPGAPLSLHVHRCLQVKVAVTFNGKTLDAKVAPGLTIAALKTHFAVRLFGMDRADAAEHVLQLSGTHERPDPDTHVGSLTRNCAVAFDLVPLVRVEG